MAVPTGFVGMPGIPTCAASADAGLCQQTALAGPIHRGTARRYTAAASIRHEALASAESERGLTGLRVVIKDPE